MNAGKLESKQYGRLIARDRILPENGAINDPPTNIKDSPLYPRTSQT